MEQAPSLLFSIVQGVGLAACAGMRAFLPLLVVGAAGRFEWIRLSPGFDWLSSTPALVVFGVAVALELLADKIPVVDHALDLVQFAVKPVAGTILAASVMVELTPLQATVLGLVTGGVVADAVHLGKTKVRLLSTATTGGTGNPLISAAEDGGSLLGSLLGVFFPFVLMLVIVVAALALWLAWRSLRRRRVRSASP